MPHIHTKSGQIDHTVTAYIVRDDDEPRILLHMHKKLGKLLPVGGHIELDETPWAALAHEVEEESGYLLSQLEVLQPSLRIGDFEETVTHPVPIFMNTHTITEAHWHSDAAYLLRAHDEPAKSAAEGESLDVRWLSRSEVAALTKDDIWDNTRGTCLAIFDKFLSSWEPLPATMYRTDKIIG